MTRVRLFCIALILAVVMIFHQTIIRRLIFFPETSVAEPYPSLLVEGGFVAADGEPSSPEFRGYLKTPKQPKKLVAIFHGNAGHAAHRIYMTEGFRDDNSTVVFLAEYPGYGARPGAPSEKSLFAAAEDDLRWLQKKFPGLPLILMGESLGTGVAARMATLFKSQAVILASPFDSLTSAAKFHYAFLPVDFLLKDRFDSAAALQSVTAPLLIIHGDQDNVVPLTLGQRLHDSYGGPKDMLVLAGFGHNDLPWDDKGSALWRKISAFLVSPP